MISYTPRGATGFDVEVVSGHAHSAHVQSRPGVDLVVDGTPDLIGNVAFCTEVAAFGANELAYRRARSQEKRKSHRKAAQKHAKRAEHIADLVGRLGDREAQGWCSGCFELSSHVYVRGHDRPLAKYLCGNCGTPSARCAVPRCGHFAVVQPGAVFTLCYCAEHHHAIPSFAKLGDKLSQIEDYEKWLEFKSSNAARATKVAGGTLASAIVIAPAAFLAAPVVGAALGGSALGGGLTGAVATSHGLAMLGGGSLASGGLGVAGGTAVVTASGSALGGILGATTTTGYVGSDKSFKIEKLRDGVGPAVLVASGFLTEGDQGWGPWQKMIDRRFPDNPVYRVHWGAKELKTIGVMVTSGSAKIAARKVLTGMAKRGSKTFGSLPGLGVVLASHEVVANPWSVAKNRAAMTGAILADIIARTDGEPVHLVGHSLGARVMVHCAQALGTRGGVPRIASVHLLGAAVGTRGDWRTLDAACVGTIWNYWSPRDDVLRLVYSLAEGGQKAAGQSGFKSKFPRIKDRNVGRIVPKHSAYFDVTLEDGA